MAFGFDDAAAIAGIGSSIAGLFGGGEESHSNLQTNYVYTMFPPQYETDAQGNVVDASGKVLHKQYNDETGAVYWTYDDGTTGTPAMGEGYEDWSKIARILGGEGGLQKAYRVVDDMMTGAPGALDEYLSLIGDTQQTISELPAQYQEMMAPYVSAYATLGEKYLKYSDEWAASGANVQAKYETIWNDIRSQSNNLNVEYAAVQKEYENAYTAAPKTMPGISFGNTGVTTAGLPNYKLQRENLAPISESITNRSNLWNTANQNLLNVAGGMSTAQNATNQSVLDALQGYGQYSLTPRQAITQGQFNINAAVPYDIQTLGAERNKWLFEWPMTQGLVMGTGANAPPVSGSAGTNWSNVLNAASDALTGIGDWWNKENQPDY